MAPLVTTSSTRTTPHSSGAWPSRAPANAKAPATLALRWARVRWDWSTVRREARSREASTSVRCSAPARSLCSDARTTSPRGKRPRTRVAAGDDGTGVSNHLLGIGRSPSTYSASAAATAARSRTPRTGARSLRPSSLNTVTPRRTAPSNGVAAWTTRCGARLGRTRRSSSRVARAHASHHGVDQRSQPAQVTGHARSSSSASARRSGDRESLCTNGLGRMPHGRASRTPRAAENSDGLWKSRSHGVVGRISRHGLGTMTSPRERKLLHDEPSRVKTVWFDVRTNSPSEPRSVLASPSP